MRKSLFVHEWNLLQIRTAATWAATIRLASSRGPMRTDQIPWHWASRGPAFESWLHFRIHSLVPAFSHTCLRIDPQPRPSSINVPPTVFREPPCNIEEQISVILTHGLQFLL